MVQPPPVASLATASVRVVEGGGSVSVEVVLDHAASDPMEIAVHDGRRQRGRGRGLHRNDRRSAIRHRPGRRHDHGADPRRRPGRGLRDFQPDADRRDGRISRHAGGGGSADRRRRHRGRAGLALRDRLGRAGGHRWVVDLCAVALPPELRRSAGGGGAVVERRRRPGGGAGPKRDRDRLRAGPGRARWRGRSARTGRGPLPGGGAGCAHPERRHADRGGGPVDRRGPARQRSHRGPVVGLDQFRFRLRFVAGAGGGVCRRRPTRPRRSRGRPRSRGWWSRSRA